MSVDSTPPAGSIKNLRDRLDEIDAEILRLVAERQATVTRIGEQKHRDGRALRDYGREKEVIDRGVANAESLGMPGHIARDIMQRLIYHSLTNQEQRQLVRSAHGAGRTALVIGGQGRMGDWLARYLDTLGFNVEIADPAEGGSLFPRIADWQTSALGHDVIAVAAPLRTSNRIMEALAKRAPKGLIFDIGSLKSPMRSGLDALHKAGCKVTSVHPMFGPDVIMLSGCHILLVETGNHRALEEARALFSHTAAECVELGIDEHDEVMSWVLGLSHLVNIAFAGALNRSHEQVPLLKRISSSTFNAQLGIAAKVVSENPHLYFEIQEGTACDQPAIETFTQVLEDLVRSIRNRDEQGFVDIMSAANLHLSADAKRAR